MTLCRKSRGYSFVPYEMKSVKASGSKLSGNKMPKPRSGHRCIANERNLYCFGGFNPQLPAGEREGVDWSDTCPLFKELWRFNFATQCWTKLKIGGTIPTKLASHSAVLSGNLLLTYGGTGVPFGQSSSNKLYVCDLNTLHWQEVEATGSPPIEQYGQAVTLKGTDLYVIGGTTGFDYTIDVHRLNLLTKEWTALPSKGMIPVARYRHEIASYEDNIFVFGGGTASKCFTFKKINCFNISTSSWSKIVAHPDMSIDGDPQKVGYPFRRRCHSLVQVDQDALICGGYNGTTIFSDVWKFDLVSHNWRRVTTTVPLPTYFHSAALTPNGRMYVYGGVHNVEENLRTSKIYSMWLKIPKLKDICWEACLHYHRDWINSSSKVGLLREGIPREFVERIEVQAECG